MPFLCTHFSNPTPIKLLLLPFFLDTILLKVSHNLYNGKSNGQFSAPTLLQPSPVFYTACYFLLLEAFATLGLQSSSPLISLAILCFSPPQCLLFIFALFFHFLDNLIKSHGFKYNLLLISNFISLSWKSECQIHQSSFLYNIVTWRPSDISVCPICSSPSRTSSKWQLYFSHSSSK